MWLVVTIGIWAWTVHLLFLSSTAELACEHHSFEWVMHAATALTAGATLAGMAVCLRLVRESPDDEGAPTVAGRNHFLGLLGLLIGGINVALILLEGIYVPFLHACR
jgi:hypothetical protein